MDEVKRVFGWYGDYDGCGYYRIVKPLDALNYTVINGDDLLDGSWSTQYDRWLPPDWVDYDVVVGQRVCNADKEDGPAFKWQQVCSDKDVLAVYEIDDDLLNISPDNPTYEFFSDAATQGNIKTGVSSADLVTVSTEPLRQVMLKYNPNVKVIPNYIDESLLRIPRPNNKGKVVIGWAGSATHKRDFLQLARPLQSILDSNKHVTFTSIGAGYLSSDVPGQIVNQSWAKSTRRVFPRIAKFDIGVIPLVSSKFNESKSYIKALEMAALGIPVVASNVTPYKEFINDEIDGFLVNGEKEWIEAIQSLVNSPELRQQMGARARAKSRSLTFQLNADQWSEAYVA